MAAEVPRCVRDARPQGRDGGAPTRTHRNHGESLARRRLGAVGQRSLLPYCARSPARTAAEGHARIRSCRKSCLMVDAKRQAGWASRSTAGAVGQSAATTQRSQYGLRAVQTARPSSADIKASPADDMNDEIPF